MITVSEARERARIRYERSYATWAVAAAMGEEDAVGLDIPLHPPVERVALGDPGAAAEWVATWRQTGVVRVVWEERRWPSLGTQQVPVRLTVTDAAELAAFAGRQAHWRVVASRVAGVVEEWRGRTTDGGEALARALRTSAGTLAALPQADTDRLREVLRWLVDHPSSGAYIRQLPVRGVDTKWTQRHRGLVTGLHRAITGRPDLGLASPPELVRVRFLDVGLGPGGLSDVSAPVEELARLTVIPHAVLVVENLETLVALPSLPGVVVVHGSGHAVDRLARVGWVTESRLLYWGDLDSHGFAILDRFRSHCPQVESVLMDRPTLESHRDLWVPEPKPTRASLARLTAEEDATLALLREEGDVRLEQERLDLDASVDALRAALAEMEA
ncbi:Wadjet anti-phage system protein JetD domain-containing protein [Georgenia sp. Marseille-Q6866]